MAKWNNLTFPLTAVSLLLALLLSLTELSAQETTPASTQPLTNSISPAPQESQVESKPIIIEEVTQPIEERLKIKITLDVRDMSVIDIVRFLAMKGNINVVTAGNIQGRATFFLKSVSIKDALDIAVISSQLAYVIENDIIRVMSGAEYEAMYGKRFNDRNIVEIFQLKYAKPAYVLSALDNIKSSLGRIIIDEDTGSVVMIDTPESVDKMKKAIKEIEMPLETVVYILQYAKADVVAEKIKGSVEASKVGTITVDDRGNRLIVRAYPGRRDEVEAVIKSYDSPTKEVLIEARILQVIFKPQMDFGIDWNLDFRDSKYQALRRFSFNSIMLDEDNLTTSSNLASKYFKIGVGDFDSNKFDMAIRALKQVSDTKVLSNPKILVVNNEEAKIHIGDTVPYIISTTSGTGESAITSEDVKFVDVGLKLNVTPTISEDGYVTMVLKPEISTVTDRITSQGGGIPQVNKTLVETTAIVKDGMTVVLGGLKKDNRVKSAKGIPLLMDIPIIKTLFSSTSEYIESTEIVIFITPHVISSQTDYQRYQASIKEAKDYEAKEKTADAKNAKLQIKK